MVFETLVSDLLNRFIGDYVENLDKSQLKIGIWGGNVVLENLRVKENALVRKLTLKIPWKNLYNDAVVATLDGLYLLVVPGTTIKYDADKEERYTQEAKQRELQRIEDALQMAARREKPQDEKKDTLMEKLAAQVIKNIQVKLTSVHIRYEDDLSDPECPLSMGVTMAELSLQTADENWKTCILNEAAKIIYKLGRLDCLCAYWNVNSPIFYRESWEVILEKLKAGISTKNEELMDHQYFFKPVFASAKMCINPTAELELKTPKANLYLEVQDIAIEITKPQYVTMVDLLQSVDCMVKNGPYRKFRPEVPVHTNISIWWGYAFKSILEVHVRRFNRMWSWSNIRQHRENLKAYKAAWKARLLTQGKLSVDTDKQVQVRLTWVIRSGQKVVAKKTAAAQKQGGGGFFGGFFSRKPKKEEQEESIEPERLDELMTTEEKEKLYTAIGYSGSSHNLAIPKQYVAVVANFKLSKTSITVRELPNVPEILKIQMIDLSTKISQRPGAQAIKVEAALARWLVTGLKQQGAVPSLIASVDEAASSLLSVRFELSPEESAADQLLHVSSQPVEIIYDALTVTSIMEFFKTGKGVDLEVLTSATLSKLEEIKEKTATGLSHIIETRTVLDLRIDLKPSYLLLPKSGFYHSQTDVIIVDFGSLQLNSVDQGRQQASSASFSSLEEIMDRAYERYSLELRSVQILYSKSGDAWKTARLQGSSAQHILQPMDFTVQLAKCMVEKDARMARFKMSGELPLIHVKISDQKIRGVYELVSSIPLPNMVSSAGRLPGVLSLHCDDRSAGCVDSDEDASGRLMDEDPKKSAVEELTDVQFKFEVKKVLLELTRQAAQENTVLVLSATELGAEGKLRSFDFTVTSYLRKVGLDFFEIRDQRNQPLHLISSSDKQGTDLLKVDFIKVAASRCVTFLHLSRGPQVEFSSLDFLLHTKALLSTINYLSSALPSELIASRDTDSRRQVERAGPGKTVSKGSKDGGVFNLKLFAMLGCFHVEVYDDQRSIADIRVQGIDVSVLVQAKETQVSARLRDIVVMDVDPKTIHKKAVSIMGEEVFSFKLSLYPSATEGEGYSDTSKVDGKVTLRLGCIQIVYLHKFLVSLLMFVDNFQTAKEALSAATAQAAEKAASSVRDFAQKSFRLSMDVRLKAPLIVIPQSSVSHNAFVVDLGLITVGNSFSLIPSEGHLPLPAVLEKMDVKLTQLKLSRTTVKRDSQQPDIEILQPINLELLIHRNLAASWFTKIPGVQVKGVLKSMNMTLGEEDFGVLMKILVENIGEGKKAVLAAEQAGPGSLPVRPGDQPLLTNGAVEENALNVLLNFEIKEVVVTLTKSQEQKEKAFLVFHMAQLGIDTKVRKSDMCATTYIKKISMKCLEFTGSGGEPLCLISSSVESGAELLKVQYFKADRDCPNFKTVYKNTEQMINVTFSSLDVLLHTEALLSTMNFLSTALTSDSPPSPEREPRPKAEEPSKALSAKSNCDVIDLKVMMQLGAFNVLVCDQSCSMAHIKIQGVNGSLLMQGPQTHLSARLRDFIVLNVDPKSIHKKAISIVGDEVFSFAMSLTPSATEGPGYTDTSKVDGRVKLNVGCIQVVYLHKFVMSLLNFTNHFHAAKEALSAATAQAAEKAASSVRDFAQKSFRLSMDVRLQAPLIIIPQSSVSHNALEVDLGLITVGNSFSALPVEGCPLPAVIDNMDVQLTELKLSRICIDPASERLSTKLLEPVNLVLSIKRNLAASWYNKMAAVEIDGDLKPMRVQQASQFGFSAWRFSSDGGVQPRQTRGQAEEEPVETVRFNFNFESLCLVLYSNDPNQRQDSLQLGQFALHQLRASGKLLADDSLEVSTILTACTLDDLRSGMQRVTSQMLGRRAGESPNAMIDVTYRQNPAEREVVAVLQRLYLCASVEFLMAVADFFVKALPQGPAQLPVAAHAAVPRTRLRAVVVDPEVVFVANLMKADAPAMVASFQCDVRLSLEPDGAQNMTANLRELKVLACPFIRSKEDKAVTTVLRPCSVVMETSTLPNRPLNGSLVVEEVIVKISPVILNTVMTIMSAMTTKPQDQQDQGPKLDVGGLWSVMDIYACNFWFLGVDQACEVTESFREQDGRNVGESFSVEVKVVQVTMASGLGHRTVPMLLAESSFRGLAKNWSSLLNLSADMTLEVNYFNETHAIWEPLIERVDNGTRRWNLKLEMKNSPVQDKSPVPGDDFVVLPEPRTAINICSRDTLNITVSQCSLSVFSNLAKAFSESTASTFDRSLMKEKAPYTIRNALGLPLMVQHSANLRVVGSPTLGKLQEVAVGQSVDLDHSMFQSSSRGKLSALQRQESCLFNLTIVPSGYSEISNIAVDQPGRRLYNVRGPSEVVSILLQIDASEGNKVMTVRSPLQIKNHFSVPFALLKYCPTSRSMVAIGVAEPEKEFHVALESYRYSQLFLQPAGPLQGQYGPSATCISWKEQVHRSTEVRAQLQCPASDSSFLPLMVSTLAAPDDLRHITNHGDHEWDPAYIIHLYPAATLRNLLPYTVHYLLEGSAEFHKLLEGSSSDVLNARVSGEIMELVLIKYQGREWHGHLRIDQGMPEFLSLCFTCDSDPKLTVDVGVHLVQAQGQTLLSLFSPYWIINKTSRVLQYRAEEESVKHPADYRDVILFSFRKKNMFSKNKIQLSVSTSALSDGFSLDTVGSYGCVRCPASTLDYLVGVSIQMSSFNLTRIVTMSPFYTLINKSSYELEVGEVPEGQGSGDVRWHYISASECLPLWPESGTVKLCVRVVGSESSSKSFYFNRQESGTLLGMDVCGGVIVDVSITDHSAVISFTDYYDGASPALVVNHTPGQSAVRELKPGKAQRFAWDDPAGVRKLSWSCLEHSGELDLVKDECGQFTYDRLSQAHWVSFLDGRQRVLLFTEDVAVVTKARQAEELEQFEQEVNVSLQNLGFSLVNNASRQEIAYVGITSSGVVWEMKPKNRWKPFNQKNINLLEKAYQSHVAGKKEAVWVKLESNIEVNFGKIPMVMRAPFSCAVRRNFLSGIQVEFKQSPHQRSLRAQLHWLQVDNQLPGAIFPIVFHPVPPPKSIALDSEPKPFIDVSIITRFNEHSHVMQFKYFMALVQEMAVKIDQDFLAAIVALFTPATDGRADSQKTKLIQRDLDSLQAELMEASMTDTSGLNFFEHFHISPIKLHLSLSLGSGGDESGRQNMVAIQSLNLLLKSIGATLTDVDDLIFKLAFFEVRYQFYHRDKLMWAVIRHYSEQFLKQMYVLVLGLDVLGNPFGMIRGLSEGVEAFFYEPFQGAVQGPEEFAEGFVIGVRSLLGHTVGGAAGMVSRITGSVGKGLAAITMDKEYQQKRREEMNRPPKDFGESLAKGGKGFLKGVVGGVTGIVTKPVEGAMKEGAAGFFKGIGKGLVGVVARPTGGIVDMASSTFQGIQRVAESTEEVTKLRPVRLIREDGIIRPYNHSEAQGLDLFQKSEIKQLEGEVFRDHCLYPGNRKTNIIVTNRRLMCVREIDFVGHFNKDWEYLFENFNRPPVVAGTTLQLYCKRHHVVIPFSICLHFCVCACSKWYSIYLALRCVPQRLQASIEQAQVACQQYKMVRQKSQRFLKPSNKP
uniref:Vacuolar protein sorting 13 homolog C n=1 Tax=Gadus morhua TaxID=8049 RepID=A0A8C5FMB7_GADMO